MKKKTESSTTSPNSSCNKNNAVTSTITTWPGSANEHVVIMYGASFPPNDGTSFPPNDGSLPVYAAPFPNDTWTKQILEAAQIETEKDQEIQRLQKEVEAQREIIRILSETLKALCSARAQQSNQCKCK